MHRVFMSGDECKVAFHDEFFEDHSLKPCVPVCDSGHILSLLCDHRHLVLDH